MNIVQSAILNTKYYDICALLDRIKFKYTFCTLIYFFYSVYILSNAIFFILLMICQLSSALTRLKLFSNINIDSNKLRSVSDHL